MELIKQEPLGRSAGILLHISSLPSPHGIGAFGRHAYEFVDFLRKAGQKYWQVLPMGPTSYGDSPYQSASAFAGNPYFIDLEELAAEGLLLPSELPRDENRGKTDYEKLFHVRYELLDRAFRRSDHYDRRDYQKFRADNGGWLDDYSLFMALKEENGWCSWHLWPEDVRRRDPSRVAESKRRLQRRMDFWRFVQYEFFAQWDKLRAYAKKNGVKIIGDLPIYVAYDSADVWANRELFWLDRELNPVRSAGVPPDLFSPDGQLWGNPLYDWSRMERDGFDWWKRRVRSSARFYDLLRIDHFIGISRYFAIPYGDQNAKRGVWIKGPGEALIGAINQARGGMKIIAEDLGDANDAVRQLMSRAGYPGMKLMQFGFDSDGANPYLPHNFEKNCVAYGGTHDNETLAGYFSKQSAAIGRRAKEYMGVKRKKEIPKALIRSGYQSCADTVIFTMQDILGLDNRARFNTPSTLGGNWLWRMEEGRLTEKLARSLMRLSELYGREWSKV